VFNLVEFSVLQCVAVCCSVLQCVVLYISSYPLYAAGAIIHICIHHLYHLHKFESSLPLVGTGWRRLIGCLNLQVIFRKTATNYRALLRKMTYEIRHPMRLRHAVYPLLQIHHVKNQNLRDQARCRNRFLNECNTLQRTATCVASIHSRFAESGYFIMRCSVLQFVAVCCSVLQCVAECCSSFKVYRIGIFLDLLLPHRCTKTHARAHTHTTHVHKHRFTYPYIHIYIHTYTLYIYIYIHIYVWIIIRRCSPHYAVCCSVLQCVAVCCIVLQCVAVCCSTLCHYTALEILLVKYMSYSCVLLYT